MGELIAALKLTALAINSMPCKVSEDFVDKMLCRGCIMPLLICHTCEGDGVPLSFTQALSWDQLIK